jgi:hypothetical protein
VCVQAGTTDASNHCWIAGLKSNTEYTYKVFVKGEEWAKGERWDWSAEKKALALSGNSYDNRFQTFPDPESPASPLTFGVIGDFGVGVKRAAPDRRQQQVASALKRAVDTESVRLIITTGDNIYAGSKFLGIPIGQTGREDDDWFFTYFQPYRYIINASLCTRPSAITMRANRRIATTGARSKTTSTSASAWQGKRRLGGRRSLRDCSIAFDTGPTSSSSASTRRKRVFSRTTGCLNFQSIEHGSRRRFQRTNRPAAGEFRSRITRRSAPGPGITIRRR